MENNSIFSKIAINELKSQSDILAEKIKKMIVTQELQEGYQFPNENDFCRILNVGRGTLREAYKILDTQGYLKRTKHGTFIRRKEDIAKDGNFSATLELADYEELTEFVSALEPEAVYLAAKKVTDEQLAAIKELAAQCESSRGNTAKLDTANRRFNEKIWEACDNQLIISSLMAYYDNFNQRVLQPVYADEANHEAFITKALSQHAALIKALEGHDAKEARRIAYEHIQADLAYRRTLRD